MKRSPRLKMGKLTVRRAFLGLVVLSWLISIMGSMTFGVTALVGLSFVAVTLFHGIVLLSVYQRKPLDRRVVESNVDTRSIRPV